MPAVPGAEALKVPVSATSMAPAPVAPIGLVARVVRDRLFAVISVPVRLLRQLYHQHLPDQSHHQSLLHQLHHQHLPDQSHHQNLPDQLHHQHLPNLLHHQHLADRLDLPDLEILLN